MNTLQLPTSTAEERIRLFYTDNRQLNAEDRRIKDRIETAHAMLLQQYDNDKSICSTLMKRFDISKPQAYRDIRMAKNLFGSVMQANKEGLRYLMTQWATDLFRMSHKTKNLKGMEKAIERITKVNNLDKEDQDLPDPSRIQPPVQLLSVNFNFINSPMFKLIDDAAQKALLKLYDEFMLQVKVSPLAEYTDMWKIDDSVRPKNE